MSRTNIRILKTNSNFIEIRFISEASAVRHDPIAEPKMCMENLLGKKIPELCFKYLETSGNLIGESCCTTMAHSSIHSCVKLQFKCID